MLRPTLIQSQEQRMQQILAPQMRQSLEFLQVPLLELRTLIQKELELNPVLEEQPANNEQLEVEPGTREADREKDAEFEDQYEKLAQLDDAWRDYFAQAGSARPYTRQDEERRQFMLDSLSVGESLQEHLLGQLGLTDLDDESLKTAEMLIGSINEDGYLNVTLGELSETTGHTIEHLEAVLRAIQDMDPVGVGARDLRECVMLQIGRLGLSDRTTERLVQDHLEDLGARRYADLARKLGVPAAEIRRAAQFIATLEPRPGRRFTAEVPTYVVPELSIQQGRTGFQVVMNNDQLPHVRISRHYRQLIENPDTPEETKAYIRDKIRAGLFMIKSIHQRQQTLRRIAEEIVRVQEGFFVHGISRLRPLVMADIAKVLGVHETTVSRAISGKYLQTAQGVFEIKYFFTPGYRTADGREVSNKTIKDTLAMIIAEEDPDAPLSDQAIADILKKRGIKVARRTIAKYREELKILPSHLRKSA